MKDKNQGRRSDIIEKIKQRSKEELNPQKLANELLAGDKNALASSVTLIESVKDSDSVIAAEVLRHILPHSGNSLRIGITGSPGAGKSTFIEAFGMFLLKLGKKVAVLAVDPSSESGKGSILGDKTRMNDLAAHPDSFIRPSPSSGNSGGVARKTRECIFLCEAAGFDTILIETVGVGQSETAVKSMVDVFLLLSIAGAGDELQGIKRGIMEMADIVLVNKADGDNLNRSKAAKSDIQRALHLFPPSDSGWIPLSLLCSSINSTGLEEVWNSIEKFESQLKTTAYFKQNRENQSKWWLKESIQEKLLNDFNQHPAIKKEKKILEKKVQAGELSVSEASERLVQLYKSK
ncbi:MAG: methylmalonyl Co-A mutase-associated GTPase MeaB [Bacteroidia bacterium]